MGVRVRAVILVTIALFLGIAALVLHSLAICSPHWKITKRDREPEMAPVSYGLWQRCEYINFPMTKQGVALGTQNNTKICRPNHYMRYSPAHLDVCYSIRRNCLAYEKDNLPEGCSCVYLPSTKGLQWLTILAAICLILGLLLLYLKVITSPETDGAAFILNYGPFICFLLTLMLMVTGLILLGAYLRRDSYEDFSFPSVTVTNQTHSQSKFDSFDLYSLKIYAKKNEQQFSYENYRDAKNNLLELLNTHYHTAIGWATGYEIIATVLIFLVTAITFWLGISSRSDDI